MPPSTSTAPSCSWSSLYRTQGAKAAGEAFRTEMKGYEDCPPRALPNPENMDNFWANEFMQLTIYLPDLRKVLDNKVSISVVAGEKSRDAFYARTTIPQSEILGCPWYVLPGNHSGYELEPDAFCSRRSVIWKAGRRYGATGYESGKVRVQVKR